MAKIHKGIGIGAGFAYKGKALNFTRDVYDNFTDLLYDASTYGFPDGFKTVVIDPTDNDKFNDVSYKYGTFMYSNGTWTLASYNGIDALLNQSDAKIEDLKTSTESMEKAVANSLFELKDNTYTKTESDGKYTVIGSSYTKAESDEKYALTGSSYTKAESDELKASVESMEKAIANSLFELKYNTYTKTESDQKYSATGTSYTKSESDNKYALIGESYTKAESDKIYSLKKDVYDKQYMDEKFKVISSGLNELDERCNGFATKADVPYKFVTVETI